MPDSQSLVFRSEFHGCEQLFRVALADGSITQISRGWFDWALRGVLPDGQTLLVDSQSMLRPQELSLLNVQRHHVARRDPSQRPGNRRTGFAEGHRAVGHGQRWPVDSLLGHLSAGFRSAQEVAAHHVLPRRSPIADWPVVFVPLELPLDGCQRLCDRGTQSPRTAGIRQRMERPDQW